jgi:CRISPR-associated endonuclease/helicase Cas3
MNLPYFARANKGEYQLLWEHLKNVAEMMEQLLPYELKEIGYQIGLLHDLGKYNPDWQEYLMASLDGIKKNNPNHVLSGGFYWLQGKNANPIASAISYGHHEGLLKDVSGYETQVSSVRNIYLSKLKNIKQKQDGKNNPLEYLDILENELPGTKARLEQKLTLPNALPKELDFIIRLLFSGLIHCDRLDAQYFCSGKPNKKSLPKRINFPEFSVETEFDRLRTDFTKACIDAAKNIHEKGIYQLKGICGIGKTIASLQFAWAHQQSNDTDMEGIIYVAPLKTVIEQTGSIWEQVLGKDNVLIHYSDRNVDSKDVQRYRQETEQWDANYIVTSAVQFFESIYATHPSKCRKLANIRKRTIIIDEVQTLPVHLINLCLDALENLVKYCGCTVLLMSGTQLDYKRFREIDYPHLITDSSLNARQIELENNHVEYQYISAENNFWEAIADNINQSGYHHSLTVVSTVKRAETGFELLSQAVPGKWTILTAKNCPVERRDVFETLPTTPEDWKRDPHHVISTSLLNTGVDINFPLINGELAGIDELIQLAGRLDRLYSMFYAKLPLCRLSIFDPHLDGFDGDRSYRLTQSRIALQRLGEVPMSVILEQFIKAIAVQANSPSYRSYPSVQDARDKLDLDYVAKNFKLINDFKEPVLTNYKYGEYLIEKYKDAEEVNNYDWRLLQPYQGRYSPGDIKRGIADGTIGRSPAGLYYLVS